jgi:hypothetical protein
MVRREFQPSSNVAVLLAVDGFRKFASLLELRTRNPGEEILSRKVPGLGRHSHPGHFRNLFRKGDFFSGNPGADPDRQKTMN